jgi:photosystem II stability/assembly factor-like uncharacterized protein
MKKIFLILLIFHFSLLIANSQWIRQVSGTTGNITDVEFINRYTGWACGDNIIYKTTNAGQNWILQPNPAQCYIEQICPVDSNIVYAAGWFTMLKTTNGGQNWIGIFAGTYGSGLPQLEGVHFINSNTGWFCGNMRMLKTTNGCQSWDSTIINGYMWDIYFRNELEGVSCGEYCMYKTTNGGINWNLIQMPFTTFMQMFFRISFVNNQFGWVAGNGKNIYRTTNFGSNWDSIGYISEASESYSVRFSGLNTGFSGGTFGKLFKTTDGGHNWRQENISNLNPGYIMSIWAFNDSVLWAVGGGGMIIHTTTGGEPVGIINNNQKVSDKFILYQNYPNPFNPTTNIKYQIANSKYITLKVYNLLGKEITALVNEYKKVGTYEVNFDGSNLSSGIYFYSLFADGKIMDTKKFVLLK